MTILSFPHYTGAEVAAVYNGLRAKGHHKLAAYLFTNYAHNAPSNAHFAEFFNLIEEVA